MAPPEPTPKRECPQCWEHAHNPRIHRSQDQSKDCPQCVAHMRSDCGRR